MRETHRTVSGHAPGRTILGSAAGRSMLSGLLLALATSAGHAAPVYTTVSDGIVLDSMDYDGADELLIGPTGNGSVTNGRAYTAANADVTLRNVNARDTDPFNNHSGWHASGDEPPANSYGGAFVVEGDASLTLVDVEISRVELRNGTPGGESFGGAIYVREGGRLTLIDTGLGHNRAYNSNGSGGTGHGIYFRSGSGAHAPVFQATPGGVTSILDPIADDGAGSVGIVVGDPNGVNTGPVYLLADNDHTGGTTFAPGELVLFNVAALGSGGLTFDGGTLNLAATLDLTQPITLAAGGGTLDDSGGVIATFTGTISGSGALTKTGTGSYLVAGNNSYSGGTVVDYGYLRPGSASAFGSGPLTVNTHATVDLASQPLRVGGLSGNGGRIILGGAGLTVDQAADSTYAGSLEDTGSLTKEGSGTLTLSGTSSYTGGTAVNAGTLIITGSITGTVNVASGAALGGDGTAGTQLQVNGRLAPGTSPGGLSVGDLVLGPGSVLDYELGAPDPTGTPGITGDLIQASGDVTLDGSLQVTDAGGFGAGRYLLLEYAGSLSGSLAVGSLPTGYAGTLDSATAGQVWLDVAAIVDGACGSAHGSGPLLSAPASGLCSAGSAGPVATTAAQFAWSCLGSNSGADADCSATRGYQVSPSAGEGGSIAPSGAQTVAYHDTIAFTLTPEPEHVVDRVQGCGGSLVGDTYTTGPITGDCSVSARFFIPIVPLLTAGPLLLLALLLGALGWQRRRGEA